MDNVTNSLLERVDCLHAVVEGADELLAEGSDTGCHAIESVGNGPGTVQRLLHLLLLALGMEEVGREYITANIIIVMHSHVPISHPLSLDDAFELVH